MKAEVKVTDNSVKGTFSLLCLLSREVSQIQITAETKSITFFNIKVF